MGLPLAGVQYQSRPLTCPKPVVNGVNRPVSYSPNPSASANLTSDNTLQTGGGTDSVNIVDGKTRRTR